MMTQFSQQVSQVGFLLIFPFHFFCHSADWIKAHPINIAAVEILIKTSNNRPFSSVTPSSNLPFVSVTARPIIWLAEWQGSVLIKESLLFWWTDMEIFTQPWQEVLLYMILVLFLNISLKNVKENMFFNIILKKNKYNKI